MKSVIIIISDGFEEIEAITVIDILRRANIDITIVSIEEKITAGAHDIKIEADKIIDQINYKDFDMVILPGGLPNAFNLAQDEKVQTLLQNMKDSKKLIAAICAAPYALHKAGVLNKNYTCYPSFEEKIRLEGYKNNEDVIIDKDVITSRGPGTAMNFALQLVKTLCDEKKSLQIKTELLAK